MWSDLLEGEKSVVFIIITAMQANYIESTRQAMANGEGQEQGREEKRKWGRKMWFRNWRWSQVKTKDFKWEQIRMAAQISFSLKWE